MGPAGGVRWRVGRGSPGLPWGRRGAWAGGRILVATSPVKLGECTFQGCCQIGVTVNTREGAQAARSLVSGILLSSPASLLFPFDSENPQPLAAIALGYSACFFVN